jgi:hypothetical protein
MKRMHQGNAWRVAGVADPGYCCNGKYVWAGRASKRVSVNGPFSADVSCCTDVGAYLRLSMNAAQLALNTYWSAPLLPFADHGDEDLSQMRCAAMFE